MTQETMDVVQSLLKISRELLEVDTHDEEAMKTFLQGASWLIEYIANGLDTELQHAAERGRKLAMRQYETGAGEYINCTINPDGKRIYGVLDGGSI